MGAKFYAIAGGLWLVPAIIAIIAIGFYANKASKFEDKAAIAEARNAAYAPRLAKLESIEMGKEEARGLIAVAPDGSAIPVDIKTWNSLTPKDIEATQLRLVEYVCRQSGAEAAYEDGFSARYCKFTVIEGFGVRAA